jgi:hypothetical protein
MYGWLWKRLPGPWVVKLLQSMALASIVVLLLFVFVFPWAEPRLPFNKVTVDGNSSSTNDLPAGSGNDPSQQAPASGVTPGLGG